ncbi:MAG TPA: Fe-S cluster assembly protein SufD [Cyclobacteriaceae bacterium]|nr:Fe-S cluster assembly protein SufD [Cyclobacteriaceae bacterium]
MTITTKKSPKEAFLEAIANGLTTTKFASLKDRALSLLEEHGLPSNKAEEYKYTPITRKLENTISNFTEAAPADISKERVLEEHIAGMDADVIVFNNGRFAPELSTWDQNDFRISPLSQVAEEVEQKGFGQIAKLEKDPFNVLNTVMFQDGVFIEIADGTRLAKPLVLLSFNQANIGQTIFPRVFIKVGKSAEVTLIEKIISLDDQPYFLNDVTEISVAENSHLYYYKMQNQSREAIEVSNFETDIHRDGTYSSAVVSLQGGMIRNNLNLNLLDSNCEGNMYGLYLLDGKTHVDNHTGVDHIKPHSLSNELYKGILSDQSRGVFNGKIFVRQDAQKTNAFQQNSNILLSDDATINTKPQLEIWADDVKCSHGCTAGQLDEEALFYLRARGISKDKAKGLLLHAFAGEVLEHIKNDAFREYCIQEVAQRLGSDF